MGVGLDQFTIADAVELSAAIRAAGVGASSMEEVANAIVSLMGQATTPDEADAGCVLVRCFVTDQGSRLPAALVTRAGTGHGTIDAMHLVLLATEGIEPAWCDRRQSESHQLVPLVSEEMIATYPMISRMFRQFGVPFAAFREKPLDSWVDPTEHAFGVFHVEEALGSPYLTDPKFIEQYGVKSVVAFGGPLPTGDIFSVLLFSRAQISREVASLMQLLAVSMKLALLPVLARVFVNETAPERPQPGSDASLRVETAALRSLLDVQGRLVADHYRRLEASAQGVNDAGLTPREEEILHLVATGATNKQIALNLALTSGTVKWHLYNLFQKLAVETRTEAVIVAQQQGLIS